MKLEVLGARLLACPSRWSGHFPVTTPRMILSAASPTFIIVIITLALITVAMIRVDKGVCR